MRKDMKIAGFLILLALSAPTLADSGANRTGKAVGETAGKAAEGARRVYDRSAEAVEKGLNTANEKIGRALGRVDKSVREFADGVEEGLEKD